MSYYRIDAMTVKARKLAGGNGHRLGLFQRPDGVRKAYGKCEYCAAGIVVNAITQSITGSAVDEQCDNSGCVSESFWPVITKAFVAHEPLYSKER
jgi:hypothetical protein